MVHVLPNFRVSFSLELRHAEAVLGILHSRASQIVMQRMAQGELDLAKVQAAGDYAQLSELIAVLKSQADAQFDAERKRLEEEEKKIQAEAEEAERRATTPPASPAALSAALNGEKPFPAASA